MQDNRTTDIHRQALYTTLAQIPAGRVVTYGQLAKLVGRPGAARWIGQVLRQLPPDSQLPWHRVVAAGGRISLDGPAGQRQRERLEREGVHFNQGRVALKNQLWLTALAAHPPGGDR